LPGLLGHLGGDDLKIHPLNSIKALKAKLINDIVGIHTAQHHIYDDYNCSELDK